MKNQAIIVILALLVLAFGMQVFMFYQIYERLDQQYNTEKKLDLSSHQDSDTWVDKTGQPHSYQELLRMRNQIEQMFEHSVSEFNKVLSIVSNTKVSEINLITEPNRYIAMINLADAIVSSLDVSVNGRKLTISIKTDSNNNEINDKRDYQQNERFSGEFRGSLILPTNINKEKITTEYRGNVLVINLPKA